MPCDGSFDMKPQNVKIVEVSMGSTELRNCWLRTCQRHSLRKINMGIMSIDLCIFGGYNNQLFRSWDYNQLSSWTNISYHTLKHPFLEGDFWKRVWWGFCAEEYSSFVFIRYFGSSPRLYAVVYPASAFRTRSLGTDQTCDTGVTGVIGSNSFIGITSIDFRASEELNWIEWQFQLKYILERLYIVLWSTLLLTLLRSTMPRFWWKSLVLEYSLRRHHLWRDAALMEESGRA